MKRSRVQCDTLLLVRLETRIVCWTIPSRYSKYMNALVWESSLGWNKYEIFSFFTFPELLLLVILFYKLAYIYIILIFIY